MSRFPDLTGFSFNRLYVEEYVGHWSGSHWWRCVCSCGSEIYLRGVNLRNGSTRSCGCLRREGAHTRRHGMTKTTEHKVWTELRQRCFNENDKGWPRYGGRGITVSPRWLGRRGFENFYEDMGTRPAGLSLDRIDNNGPYSPENCRWADRVTQARNRRSSALLTYDGRTQCLTAWAAEIGIPRATLSSRIRHGWSVERALTEPVHVKVNQRKAAS